MSTTNFIENPEGPEQDGTSSVEGTSSVDGTSSFNEDGQDAPVDIERETEGEESASDFSGLNEEAPVAAPETGPDDDANVIEEVDPVEETSYSTGEGVESYSGESSDVPSGTVPLGADTEAAEGDQSAEASDAPAAAEGDENSPKEGLSGIANSVKSSLGL